MKRLCNRTGTLSVGRGTIIEPTVKMGDGNIIIGDHCYIGLGVKLVGNNIKIGDYTTIYDNVLVNGNKPFVMGNCCWVGQNAILNSTGGLDIGNGVMIGAAAQVWSHSAAGDTLNGWQYKAVVPVSLEDDVWLAPASIVACKSMGEKSALLAGGVLSKNAPDNTAWGGNPAKDITGRIGPPYVEIPTERRFSQMETLLLEFLPNTPDYCLPTGNMAMVSEGLGIVCSPSVPDDGIISYFNVFDMTFSSIGTAVEVRFMRFLLPEIKFYPRNVV